MTRALVALSLFAVLALAATGARAAPSEEPDPALWQGLLGERPVAQLGQRQIVLLRGPSLADRVRRNGPADEQQMRSWARATEAAQEQVLLRLAQKGVAIEPEYRFIRVVNGFSAALDSTAIAQLQRDPAVEDVFPVRAAYPLQVDPGTVQGQARGVAPRRLAPLPGFDGSGVVVALLDTGIDEGHPYIAGRVLPGIDVVDPASGASAEDNPTAPGRRERHGTEMAGIVAGDAGAGVAQGVAPGASILPIRVAGWQPDAAGDVSVYGRSDQVLAGVEAAVDPDGDGATQDAARVALIGVAEPFASFPESPLAQAVAGALELDTLVVAPAGNDGPAGPGYGSIAGPGGSTGALTVGALDARRVTPTAHVLLRVGLRTLLSGEQPLGGAISPDQIVRAKVVVAPVRASGQRGVDALFGAQGLSLVAGRAVLLPRADSSPEAVRDAVAAGAAAVLVDGPLPAGALGPADAPTAPVLGLPARVARELARQLALGREARFDVGAAATGENPGATEVAPFSSRGLAFDGGPKPDLAAPGIGLLSSTTGRTDDGRERYTTVSGTSAAAAVVAGLAVVLAQARPELDARGLGGALVAGAAPLPDDPDAVGAGALDPDAAAAAELVADPPALGLGGVLRPGRVTGEIGVRNVSRRPLDVRVLPAGRPGEGVQVAVRPSSLRLGPGRDARLAVSVRLSRLPRPPSAVRGTIRLVVRGGAVLRVRWAVAVERRRAPLLRNVKLSRRVVTANAKEPVVLELVAGRVDGSPGRPQVLPLARLDIDLYRGERLIGRLARLSDLLPGRYALGLTGRSPAGGRLGVGDYVLRVTARSLTGRQAVARVRFAVR